VSGNVKVQKFKSLKIQLSNLQTFKSSNLSYPGSWLLALNLNTMKEINASEFEKEVLQAENAVVDFYSTECPPCEALAPKFEALAGIFGNRVKFLKIFRQQNRSLAEE